jgi:uncharacterized protein YjbI with pentapeptide repeats
VDSLLVGYDGSPYMRDQERSVGQKEPNRKGSEETNQSRWGFRGMTVRDWMELLIVPLSLVVIGLVFTAQQDQRQQRAETQRAEAERELAQQRAQDEALQAYLDQMGTLLLEEDLRKSERGSEVRTLARARTLTVLDRLDPSRKAAVVRFLDEAELVTKADEGGPVIALTGADLSNANLHQAHLSGADLTTADLNGADLTEADLYIAYLFGADLSGADVRYADVSYADVKAADLSGANLYLADLKATDLSGTDLHGANLREVDLSRTYLRGANLRDAQGVTDDQLAKAKSLEGATMPNGQKYEHWRKSREGRGEDGKNSGSS